MYQQMILISTLYVVERYEMKYLKEFADCTVHQHLSRLSLLSVAMPFVYLRSIEKKLPNN